MRIILGATDQSSDPIDADGNISIQGELIRRATASIVVVVDGLTPVSNETFHSTMEYRLDRDLQFELFQSIPLDSMSGAEWLNFDGTQDVYMFVYGSLMRSDDLQHAGIPTAEAKSIDLHGWMRSWTVASDPSEKHRQYYYRDSDGQKAEPFRGNIVSLGLIADATKSTKGIAVRVTYRILADFDRREIDYDRVDVTQHVGDTNAAGFQVPFRLFTYVPKRAAIEKFERLRSSGDVVIVKSYYDTVKEAARSRGPELLRGYDQTEVPSGVPVVDMIREDGVVVPP